MIPSSLSHCHCAGLHFVQVVVFSAAPRERYVKGDGVTSDRPGFPVLPVYCSKEKKNRKNEAGCGLQRTEQIFEAHALQDSLNGLSPDSKLKSQDAYWHVPVHPRFRHFLTFQEGREKFIYKTSSRHW